MESLRSCDDLIRIFYELNSSPSAAQVGDLIVAVDDRQVILFHVFVYLFLREVPFRFLGSRCLY